MSGSDGQQDIDIADMIDVSDRFERTLDHQIQTLNDIDNKAEHVTRLLGVLIGALLSVLAVAARLSDGNLSPPNTPLFVLFVAGIVSLVLAMVLSIITYLSSRFKIGLHYRPAYLLSQTNYSVDKTVHYKRIIGTYAHNLETNETVIEVNSRRFRRALVSLLIGVVFLSAAGIAYVSSLPPYHIWLAAVGAAAFSAGISWYILTGRYLTLEAQS